MNYCLFTFECIVYLRWSLHLKVSLVVEITSRVLLLLVTLVVVIFVFVIVVLYFVADSFALRGNALCSVIDGV